MFRRVIAICVPLATSSCSGGSGQTQADCDKLATEIRNAAVQRNIPAQGACERNIPDLAQACADLAACNAAQK
jgi:hypothetical protein